MAKRKPNNHYKRLSVDLGGLETDKVKSELVKRLNKADKIYFEPLRDPVSSGEVPTQMVADMHLLFAELMNRYLTCGF